MTTAFFLHGFDQSERGGGRFMSNRPLVLRLSIVVAGDIEHLPQSADYRNRDSHLCRLRSREISILLLLNMKVLPPIFPFSF